ncbi:MAG: tetratricopeptide repeat protein, partial [Planctomycetes bacterium]|nr:tetratricopeptide repeat protein [Planctomycetota bacterium]
MMPVVWSWSADLPPNRPCAVTTPGSLDVRCKYWPMNRRYILFFSLLVVLAALSSLTFYWGGQRWNEHLRSSAQRALDEERFEEAESYASRLAARKSGDREALLLAGEAAMLGGHSDRAIEYFQPLLQGEDEDSLVAICAVGEIWFKKGESRKAERMFRRALELDPGQLFATNRLVYLLLLQGRRREELPLRFRLVKAGQFTSEDLRLLANPRAMADNPEIVVSEKAEPDNPQWWLVRGQMALRKGQAEEGARLLRKVVEKRPNDADAQANLGLALLDSATPYEFWTWHQQVPASAEELADLWVVRGLWARQNNQPEAAVRCFWEALRRESTHQLACYQLALALPAIGRENEAEPFNRHTTRLRVLISLVDLMYTQLGDDPRTMQLAANFCEEMGRYWEAVGWHHVVLTKAPANAQSRESMIRLASRLGDGTPQIDQRYDPASLVDFSRLPLPRMERPAETPRGPSDRVGNLAIQFADVAPSSGLNFSYFNGDDPDIKGRRMFEFTGGGVAILDYDLDGWPDIYFTQGCHMPSKGREVYRDALFRNLGDGRFLNVTEQAGLGDDRFGQGVTAGDYNSDGYPDLYVGNVGPNRLYRNNGDGTFTDVTEETEVGGDVWTTSCLIVDLDGDRWADLYLVNYLAGNAVELMCEKTCSPGAFDAELDTFYHSRGDGTFVNRTVEA